MRLSTITFRKGGVLRTQGSTMMMVLFKVLHPYLCKAKVVRIYMIPSTIYEAST